MLKRSRGEASELSENRMFSLGEFHPSRGRVVERNALAGAAQNQLSGKALPSLIVGMGEWRDAEDHVRAAPHVCPTADLINAALNQRSKTALWQCDRQPSNTNGRLENALNVLKNIAESLEPQRQHWANAPPARSPAAAINFPPIFLM